MARNYKLANRSPNPRHQDVPIQGKRLPMGYKWVDIQPNSKIVADIGYSPAEWAALPNKVAKIAILLKSPNVCWAASGLPRFYLPLNKDLADPPAPAVKEPVADTEAKQDIPVLKAVLAFRDGAYCQACGLIPAIHEREIVPDFQGGLEFDHIIPEGPTSVENGQLLCRRCNGYKNKRPMTISQIQKYLCEGRRGGLANKEARIRDPQDKRDAFALLIRGEVARQKERSIR